MGRPGKHKERLYTYAGHTRTLREWAETTGTPMKNLYRRIHNHKWEIDAALIWSSKSREGHPDNEVMTMERAECIQRAVWTSINKVDVRAFFGLTPRELRAILTHKKWKHKKKKKK